MSPPALPTAFLESHGLAKVCLRKSDSCDLLTNSCRTSSIRTMSSLSAALLFCPVIPLSRIYSNRSPRTMARPVIRCPESRSILSSRQLTILPIPCPQPLPWNSSEPLCPKFALPVLMQRRTILRLRSSLVCSSNLQWLKARSLSCKE